MTKKIQIALMCTSLHNMAGGLERQIIRTASALSDLNYQVFIVSFDSIGDASFYPIPDKVTWLKCGNSLTPHQASRKRDRLKQLWLLRQTLINNRIKCLITFHHGLYFRSFIVTLFLRIKNIVSERNSLSFYNYVSQSKINPAYFLSFFANARTVQVESYKKEYPSCFRHKIYTIPNIVSKHQNSFSSPALHSKTIGLLGRLENQKNFLPLLDQMLSYYPDISFKVKIAGDGSLKQYIEDKYRVLIASKKLVLLGNIHNVHSFLSSCSVFCFPSLWEGFPNALLEALSCSLPIVLTNRLRNLEDFVVHGENGYIVSDEQLFNTVESLISDYDAMHSFSKNSYSKFLKLSSQSPVSLWDKLIQKVVK